MFLAKKDVPIRKAVIALTGYGTRFLPATKQLFDVFNRRRATVVLGVQQVPWEEIHKYCSIQYKKVTKINEIEGVVEKADRDHAFSN